MASVSYRIFEEFVKKNELTKQYWSNADYGIDYIDSQGVIKASQYHLDWDRSETFLIDSEEAENLNTLEFVNNIINGKRS